MDTALKKTLKSQQGRQEYIEKIRLLHKLVDTKSTFQKSIFKSSKMLPISYQHYKQFIQTPESRMNLSVEFAFKEHERIKKRVFTNTVIESHFRSQILKSIECMNEEKLEELVQVRHDEEQVPSIVVASKKTESKIHHNYYTNSREAIQSLDPNGIKRVKFDETVDELVLWAKEKLNLKDEDLRRMIIDSNGENVIKIIGIREIFDDLIESITISKTDHSFYL